MSSARTSGSFMSTRWTLVRRANASPPEGQAALRDLCAAYLLELSDLSATEVRRTAS